ncbi:hypothetical protein V2J09_020887 [Rumex salicifolius]
MESDPISVFLNLEDWQYYDHGRASADDDDEVGAVDPQLSLSSSSETYLLGFVLVNIVGLQYYTGSISGREMVGLVREPLNIYDENAIKVLNTRGVQVGHIERVAARVLSPLIDTSTISVEGIVPNPGSKHNKHKIPCQIHVFARLESFSVIKSEFKRAGLALTSEASPSFALSESISVKETRSKELNSLDEIFKLVDEKVSQKTGMAPLVPPKGIIPVELLAHQKEALGWLVDRENSSELPPFWSFKDKKYVNVLTNFQTEIRPQPLRGGIFADDMGLGKTLTLLSLIAFDKSGDGECVGADQTEENDTLETVISGNRNSKKRRMVVASGSRKEPRKESRGGKGKDNAIEMKTTLVVCPPSVFSAWVSQLLQHTRKGSFKVYMYYGERTKDVEELKKFDIVLTTYSTLGTEVKSSGSPLTKMKWWRVILDEAHLIKNVNAQQTKAVTCLQAERRWAVTGTPIQNSTVDLFALMTFLRFEPFSDKSYWNNLIQRPLAQGQSKGLTRLQAIMATISLRRTKEKVLIDLPPKVIETCYLELSSEERQLYEQVEEEAKNIVNSYINAGNVMRNYTTVLSLILRLRQICTDMALCPDDFKSLILSTNIEDVSNNPELLGKMIALLQDGEDLDCPICISPPSEVVITCCAHIFCRGCILKTLKRLKACCPMCRHPLTESDLFAAPPEPSESGTTATSSSKTNMSSKGSFLLNHLMQSKEENPKAKSVVFSQFRKMLLLLEEPLKASGFKVLRLDGTMTAKKRASVIEQFSVQGPDSPTILLASLKASGTGINLTAASTVYLLEPWWNPAVEEQAMDRVHRIGQKENVKVVRMIAKNTIEERVLDLQEKKRNLAREAFGRKGSKDKREVSVDDVRTLIEHEKRNDLHRILIYTVWHLTAFNFEIT